MTTSKRITANQREGLSVADSVSGSQFYLQGNSSSGALNVAITAGGGSGGTSSSFGSTFPTTGTAIGAISSTGTMAGLNLDSSGNLKISGSISVGGTTDESTFTAGTSTFTPNGGVFNDSVASLSSGQQGEVRLTAPRGMHVNLRNNSGTEIGVAATPIQVSLANTASNATAVKVDGSGVTQPVSLTSTTVTGAVAVTQSTSPWVVSGGGTAGAAASGVLTIQGIASMTPVQVSQATAANLNATVVGTGTLAVQNTAATPAGTNLIGKVGIDQTTPGTTNAVSANQGTAAALASPWPVYNGEQVDFTGTFTNATQTNSVTATSLDGYGNILISINGTYSTATAVFEGSDDGGTTWYAVDAARTSGSVIEGGYTSQTNATLSWQINVPGFDSVRVRSTAVASGTVNVRMSASAANGTDGATLSVAGTVANAPVAPTTINNGKTTVTTAGTRVTLASSTVVQSVTIKALAANTGTIYVGNASVASTNGFQLAAGDTISLDIANLNTINIDSSVNGEGVSYAAVI